MWRLCRQKKSTLLNHCLWSFRAIKPFRNAYRRGYDPINSHFTTYFPWFIVSPSRRMLSGGLLSNNAKRAAGGARHSVPFTGAIEEDPGRISEALRPTWINFSAFPWSCTLMQLCILKFGGVAATAPTRQLQSVGKISRLEGPPTAPHGTLSCVSQMRQWVWLVRSMIDRVDSTNEEVWCVSNRAKQWPRRKLIVIKILSLRCWCRNSFLSQDRV
jgi:hypothetical protein